MPGARRLGRPRTAWMDNIKTWTGLSVEESIRMTENRDKWRKYVHGVANPTQLNLQHEISTVKQQYELKQRKYSQYRCAPNFSISLSVFARHTDRHRQTSGGFRGVRGVRLHPPWRPSEKFMVYQLQQTARLLLLPIFTLQLAPTKFS